MRPCRECRHQGAETALICPQCSPPSPARPVWDGWGYEYKSAATLLGFSTDPPRLQIPTQPEVVARGIIAIGQFGCGVLCIAQFGIGMVSISQITVAGFALAQIGCAYALIAHIGL